MPTRRPKVPRPAAPEKPAGTRPAAAQRPAAGKPVPASTASTKPAAGSKSPAGAAAKPTAAKPASAKPTTAKPAAAKSRQDRSSSASDARAAVRSRLSGEIRRSRRDAGAAGTGAEGNPAAAETPDELRPVPAKAFSGRLLVLAMVMVAITVLLAPSVRTYLQQRSDIAAARAEIAEAQAVQDDLEVQLDRWEDPAYIKQQARDRIFLVMPGEKRYLVKGEHGVEEAEQQAAEEEPEVLQWVDSLWDSVKRSATAQ